MTEVRASVSGKHYRLEIDNHAPDSRICAGISALATTLEGAVVNNPEAQCVYRRTEHGCFRIEWIAEGDTAEEDMRIILLGLMQIAQTYPGTVNITQNIFS